MHKFVQKIEIEGLFGQGDIGLEFDPGVNILTGHNGSFKTTVLQILANALRGDFDRFVFLRFSSIHIKFKDGNSIILTRFRDRDDITDVTDNLVQVKSGERFEVLSESEIVSSEPSLHAYKDSPSQEFCDQQEHEDSTLSAVYLPAFRATVEAFRTLNHKIGPNSITNRIRFWRTPFVPCVSYPSLAEVEEALVNSQIHETKIVSYVRAVNSLLETKKLMVDQKRLEPSLPAVRIKHDNGSYSKLGSLSSGEREIVILLYTAATADQHQVLLIDEPENSLHVAWQRKLVNLMKDVGQYSQVIACTHSPVIASRYPSQEIIVHQGVSNEISYDF